ncbi:hypothetical protein KKB43_04410 [Patescibacteria group bacterium]|nr:hypothetical protein [Patescibacteria group bacterium]MBU4580232.1 hypothetical protein [Patescibacteria group bacterium]
MVNREIIDYIKAQIEKGLNKEEIKTALTSAGWQMADIKEAFRYAEQNIPIAPAPSEQGVTTLSSPTDLLKESWGIYKARFKIFIGIVLAPMIMVMIFVGIVIAGTLGIQFFNSPAMFILFMPLFFGMIILQYWSQASLIYAIKDTEENIGVKESYRRGWHKIGSIFWVGLLSGIIVMGGYLLLIIPGIIFAIWFSLTAIIVVAEDLGGMNALLKSKSYITGYWWEIFWRLLFLGLILGGISFIFGIPGWIINFVAGLTKSASLSAVGAIVSFAGSIVSFLLAPLTVIYTFLIYKNLKAIKGDIAPVFSSGEKIKFIIAGFLGVLLFFGFIIGSIVLVSLSSARDKAMDAQRQVHIQSLQAPLMLYADDHNGMYPVSLQQLVTEKKRILTQVI